MIDRSESRLLDLEQRNRERAAAKRHLRNQKAGGDIGQAGAHPGALGKHTTVKRAQPPVNAAIGKTVVASGTRRPQ